VFLAPAVQRRFGTVNSLYAVLAVIAADLLVMGLFTDSQSALIVAVIASGLFLGINNTLVTEAVMKVSPVERPVASAAYSFVRFMGGAIAPYLAGKLAEHVDTHLPFYVGAVAVVGAIVVLATGHALLSDLDGHAHADADHAHGEPGAHALGTAFAGRPEPADAAP
jgi:MFS family permease